MAGLFCVIKTKLYKPISIYNPCQLIVTFWYVISNISEISLQITSLFFPGVNAILVNMLSSVDIQNKHYLLSTGCSLSTK